MATATEAGPMAAFWGLSLLPPTLLLALICACCRRARRHGLQDADAASKSPPSSFVVIPQARGPPQPPIWRPTETILQCPSPRPPSSRRLSLAPQPMDPPAAPPDDDYTNYDVSGYVHVLPEPPNQEPPPTEGGGGAEDGSQSAAPEEEAYENLPQSPGGSLEYINLPPPGSSPQNGSGSEEGADYENL